ncbi:MAG: peroxidase [Variovorax sp.]|nr:MAG: peroxidase [Variovorax sp.]
MSAAQSVEFDDIQGLVRFGFKHLTQASFVLLRVRNVEAARAWLAHAPVTSAMTRKPPPRTALQIAFTAAGLRALGLAEDIVEGFSPEFLGGMSDASRARRLGDRGANDPNEWAWGGATQSTPHVLVMLYAVPGGLNAWQQTVSAQCKAGFDQLACLGTSDMDGVEPFGFVDGIAQPLIDWERRRAARDQEQFEYTNLACLGEFLLGYPNEYGAYTDRPLLDPRRDPTALLVRAEDEPAKADLGRNGSYLVLRQLRQDVEGFWRFVDKQAGGGPALRKHLAEAMVGRTMEGEPLAGRANTAVAGTDDPLDSFTYRADPDGLRCPLGAHIRRSNPRNADLPPSASNPIARLVRRLGFGGGDSLRNDLIASTRFHRLLRRGREYGGAGEETGLHFICLGANIARQFEFVQGAWLAAAKFDGLPDESDPLLGHRLPGADGRSTDGFSIPVASGPDQRLSGLPQFVTVLGGAYFFLPGIRALRYLSKVGELIR